MHRARFAAAVCAAAALFGAGGTARADDGLTLPTDPAGVVDTAAAIATQAADATTTGQYQGQDGQYQPDTGQYQAPAPASSPANINVSVRVLSPGDDGPVNQAISVAQPAVGGATAAPVTISVNVNITNNWTVIFGSSNDTGQYHTPGHLSWDPVTNQLATDAAAPAPAAPAPQAPEAPAAAAPPPPSAPAPAPGDHWRAAEPARPAATPVARPLKLARGTHHRAAAPVSYGRRTPVAAPVAAFPAPRQPLAWPQAHTVAKTAPAHGGAGTPPPPAPPAPPRRPSQPEQFAGAAAAGGLSFDNVLQTLGLLIASLWVAALGSARRLGVHARRLRGVVGPRWGKPG